MENNIYVKAWKLLLERLDQKTGWGKEEIKKLMLKCLLDAGVYDGLYRKKFIEGAKAQLSACKAAEKKRLERWAKTLFRVYYPVSNDPLAFNLRWEDVLSSERARWYHCAEKVLALIREGK